MTEFCDVMERVSAIIERDARRPADNPPPVSRLDGPYYSMSTDSVIQELARCPLPLAQEAKLRILDQREEITRLRRELLRART